MRKGRMVAVKRCLLYECCEGWTKVGKEQKKRTSHGSPTAISGKG
jgi:hypothetical protein